MLGLVAAENVATVFLAHDLKPAELDAPNDGKHGYGLNSSSSSTYRQQAQWAKKLGPPLLQPHRVLGFIASIFLVI